MEWKSYGQDQNCKQQYSTVKHSITTAVYYNFTITCIKIEIKALLNTF